VATGKISEGHARAILMVPGTDKQLAFLDEILKNGWSVRQAEHFARGFKGAAGSREGGMARVATSNELTRDLENYLGAKVRVSSSAKGGRLVIEYASDDELKRIYEVIRVKS
jgi:ParB family chromosome partitioning protein